MSAHSCSAVLKCFTILYCLVIWNRDMGLEDTSKLVDISPSYVTYRRQIRCFKPSKANGSQFYQYNSVVEFEIRIFQFEIGEMRLGKFINSSLRVRRPSHLACLMCTRRENEDIRKFGYSHNVSPIPNTPLRGGHFFNNKADASFITVQFRSFSSDL